MIYESLNPCGEGIVCGAAERICRRKKGLGLGSSWSLAELCADAADYEWLIQWAQSLSASEFATKKAPWRKLEIDAAKYSSRSILGLVMFHTEAEHARRHSSEESVWPAISRIQWKPEVRRQLFSSQNQPTTLHRELLQEAAEEFGLRHVFGEEGTHEWRISINLQIGFTARGAEDHLADWLRGCSLPDAAKMLRSEGTPTFCHLLVNLKQWRRGQITETAARSICRGNPWVLSERIDSILEAARRHYSPEEDEDLEGRERLLINLVSLRRLANGELRTALYIAELPVNSEASSLRLEFDDFHLGQWLADDEGILRWNNSKMVVLPALVFEGRVRIVNSETGEILREESFSLVDDHDLIAAFSWDGHRLPNIDNIKGSQSFILCFPDFLNAEGHILRSHDLAAGWRILEIGADRSDDFRIVDPIDGAEVWSPLASTDVLDVEAIQADTRLTLTDVRFVDASTHCAEACLWWSLPTGYRLCRLLVNGRSLPVDGARISFPALASDFLRGLTVRLKILGPGNSSKILSRRLEWSGLAKCFWLRRENEAVPYDPDKPLLLRTIRKPEFRFLLPDNDRYALLEGFRKVSGSTPRGVGGITGCHGYGARLRFFKPGFNQHPERDVKLLVTNSVVDSGVFSRVTLDAESVKIKFDSSRELSPRENFLIKTSGCGLVSLNPNDVQQSAGSTWKLAKPETWGSVYGIGLVYDGKPVGMWHSGSWERGLNLGCVSIRDDATFLARFKAPILTFPGSFSNWVAANFAEILPAWMNEDVVYLGSVRVGGEPLSREWMCAIQEFLGSHNPLKSASDNEVRQLCQDLWDSPIDWSQISESAAVIASVARRLIEISPWIAVSMLNKACLGNGRMKQEAEEMLRCGLKVSDDLLARAFCDTFGEAADIYFIRNVIERLARAGSIDALAAEDQFNARLALKNQIFRRLLAEKLL